MSDLIILAAVLAAIGSIAVYTLRVGVSPMPTRKLVRNYMIDLVPTDQDGVIYELGSGWGTLAIHLAIRFPACPVIGYELSPVPWAISRVWRWAADLSNLTLKRKDFFVTALGDASLVVCYLHPEGMAKLKSKLEAELKPGTLVLSHFFAIPGWTPIEERIAEDVHLSRIYLYRVGSG